MPLPREATQNPSSVDKVSFSAMNKADGTDFKVTAQFQLCDSAGKPIRTVSHEITNQITAAQKTAIENFLNAIRTKATQEILP